MTEQEMMIELSEADKELQNAQRLLSDAKRRCLDYETNVVNAKIHRERTSEALRVLRSQKVIEGEDYALYDDEDSGR
jgi:hypothetical protein